MRYRTTLIVETNEPVTPHYLAQRVAEAAAAYGALRPGERVAAVYGALRPGERIAAAGCPWFEITDNPRVPIDLGCPDCADGDLQECSACG